MDSQTDRPGILSTSPFVVLAPLCAFMTAVVVWQEAAGAEIPKRGDLTNFPAATVGESDIGALRACAQRAYELAIRKQEAAALAELGKAERLLATRNSTDFATEESLCLTWSKLGDAMRAASHYWKAASVVYQVNTHTSESSQGEALFDRLLNCKSNMPPVLSSAARPKHYTQESLAAAFREKLANEVAVATNPLATTTEMKSSAAQLTSGATDDLQKARRIFEALVPRPSPTSAADFQSPPNAPEIFAAWKSHKTSLGCQESSFLYVALARAAGLASYHALVDEDCNGLRLLHGCAAVFIGDKEILVDPAYSWFGSPHRKFRVLDDCETTALYLSGLGDLKLCQAAKKLAPDLPLIRARLLDHLMRAGRLPEAFEEVSALVNLDPDGLLTLEARAAKALTEGRPEESLALLYKALEMAPQTEGLHFMLGDVDMRLGRWPEARTAFENAARFAVYANGVRAANQYVAVVDAQLCFAKGDWDGVLTNCDRAIMLGPDRADIRGRRGNANWAKGDLDAALMDYTRAIDLDPSSATAYDHRAFIQHLKSNYVAAIADYTKAIELQSNSADIYARRAAAREASGDPQGAALDYAKALALKPSLASAQGISGQDPQADNRSPSRMKQRVRNRTIVVLAVVCVFSVGLLVRAFLRLSSARRSLADRRS